MENILVKEGAAFTKWCAVMSDGERNSPMLQTLTTSMTSAASKLKAD